MGSDGALYYLDYTGSPRVFRVSYAATQVSQEAETAEPLLSRQLYDTVRKFSQDSGKGVKDVQDEFHWDPETLGWLDSLFVVPYGTGQVPAGILCDWFGAHALLGSAVLLWSLALVGRPGLSRGVGVLGCIAGAGLIVTLLSGHLPMNVHGVLAFLLAQTVWSLGVAVQLIRNRI